MSLRIVLADDSVLLREGLELILTDAGHRVVGRAADGPSAIATVLAERPDLAIHFIAFGLWSLTLCVSGLLGEPGTRLNAGRCFVIGVVYAAFDECAEKMDKQLRRYKRRLKDHHRDRVNPVEVLGGASYILAAGNEGDEEAEPESLQPMIIAEMETSVQTISVGEAVMQMELAHAPVLVFRNEKTNGVNVVYRREDGNIGWIDPGTTA